MFYPIVTKLNAFRWILSREYLHIDSPSLLNCPRYSTFDVARYEVTKERGVTELRRLRLTRVPSQNTPNCNPFLSAREHAHVHKSIVCRSVRKANRTIRHVLAFLALHLTTYRRDDQVKQQLTGSYQQFAAVYNRQIDPGEA